MHSKQSKSVFRFLRQLTPWHFPFWRLRAVLRLIAGPPTVQQSIDISWVAARTHSSKPAAAACGGRVGRITTVVYRPRPCPAFYAAGSADNARGRLRNLAHPVAVMQAAVGTRQH